MQVLTGRLTDNAKVTTLTDGRKVVNFSIALNYNYTPKGGERRKLTTYVQCAYWISTGIASHLKRGTLAELAGFISVDAYTTLDGTAKGVLRFHVNTIQLLSGSPQSIGNTANGKTSGENATATETAPVGDLPF